jgi:hypothetical protein
MCKNEKYFLNSLRYASCHAALSSFQSSGRITADMRFAPRLGAHPNCSLRSQLLISANVISNVSAKRKTPGPPADWRRREYLSYIKPKNLHFVNRKGNIRFMKKFFLSKLEIVIFHDINIYRGYFGKYEKTEGFEVLLLHNSYNYIN